MDEKNYVRDLYTGNDKYEDYKKNGLNTWNQKLMKGDIVNFKGRNGEDLEGRINGFWHNGKTQDDDTYEEGKDNLWHDLRAVNLIDKDGNDMGSINAHQILKMRREKNDGVQRVEERDNLKSVEPWAKAWLNRGDTFDFEVEEPENDNIVYITRKNIMTGGKEQFVYNKDRKTLHRYENGGFKEVNVDDRDSY